MAALRRNKYKRGFEKYRSPMFLQRGAGISLTTAPVCSFRHSNRSLLDKRPRFGIISPAYLTMGLLRLPISVEPGVGALLFSKLLLPSDKSSLSGQNDARSAKPAAHRL